MTLDERVDIFMRYYGQNSAELRQWVKLAMSAQADAMRQDLLKAAWTPAGGDCEICGRKVRAYNDIKLTPKMVLTLLRMAEYHLIRGVEWLLPGECKALESHHMQYHRLPHFGLAEHVTERDPESGREQSKYRVADNGYHFLVGGFRVPARVREVKVEPLNDKNKAVVIHLIEGEPYVVLDAVISPKDERYYNSEYKETLDAVRAALVKRGI